MGEPGTSTAVGDQFLYGVASRPDQYLAVFSDDRAWPAYTYAARVSSSGQVLDPRGVALGGAWQARVEGGSQGYVAAWLECAAAGVLPCDLRVAGLSDADGELQIATHTLQANIEAQGLYLTRIGTSYLLVWQTGSTSPGSGGGPPVYQAPTTYTAVLDEHGNTLQGPAVLDGLGATILSLAGSPSGALLLTSAGVPPATPQRALRRLTLGPQPVLAPAQPFSAPSLEFLDTRLVYGDHVYLLVSFSGNIWRLGEDGALLDAGPLLLDPPSGSGTFRTEVSFAHHAFHVSRRLGKSFAQWSITPAGTITSENVADPGTYQRLWVDRGTGWALFSTSRRAGFVVTPADPDPAMTPLTTHGIAQRTPALASAGGTAAAAWVEAVNDEFRVQLAGGPALAQGTLAFQHTVDTLPSTSGVINPRVALGSQGGVIAWIEAKRDSLVTSLKAIRFGLDGTLLDASPLVLATEQAHSSFGDGTGFPADNALSVAPSASGWTMVHRFEWGNASSKDQLCLLDLPASGAGVATARGCVPGYRPAVSAVEGGHVVSWQTVINNVILTAQRLGPGDVLSSDASSGAGGMTAALPALVTLTGGVPQSSSATDGQRVLLSWTDSPGGGPDVPTHPRAMLFDPVTKTVLRPTFALSDDTNVQSLTSVFDGQRYWVMWRTGFAEGSLRLVRLDTQGQPLGPVETVLDAGRAWSSLALAPAAGGLLLAHTPLDESVASTRLELRRLTH